MGRSHDQTESQSSVKELNLRSTAIYTRYVILFCADTKYRTTTSWQCASACWRSKIHTCRWLVKRAALENYVNVNRTAIHIELHVIGAQCSYREVRGISKSYSVARGASNFCDGSERIRSELSENGWVRL